MAEYRVVLARSADHDFRGLPRKIQERAEKAIDGLAENARPSGVRKLRGSSDLWRIRLGNYRIIYRIDDRERLIDITHIRHRKDAYE